MIFETFDGGGILGNDHKTEVDVEACVQQLGDQPDVVLLEGPVNDGPWRAISATEAFQADSWAQRHDVPVETFDAPARNVPSHDKYDEEAVKKLASSTDDPRRLREELATEHPVFFEELVERREAEMAENIKYYTGSYETVLVVVGAVHVEGLLQRV